LKYLVNILLERDGIRKDIRSYLENIVDEEPDKFFRNIYRRRNI
jgi:hypothetical protein